MWALLLAEWWAALPALPLSAARRGTLATTARVTRLSRSRESLSQEARRAGRLPRLLPPLCLPRLRWRPQLLVGGQAECACEVHKLLLVTRIFPSYLLTDCVLSLRGRWLPPHPCACGGLQKMRACGPQTILQTCAAVCFLRAAGLHPFKPAAGAGVRGQRAPARADGR
jgi:hypothetical protein